MSLERVIYALCLAAEVLKWMIDAIGIHVNGCFMFQIGIPADLPLDGYG